MGNDSTLITLSNTFQPSIAMLMFFFEVRKNGTLVLQAGTARMKNIPFVTIFIKSSLFIASPLAPYPSGASFHFVLPLPVSSRQSWAKGAIWRLVRELYNPTYLPLTLSPPGPSLKPHSPLFQFLSIYLSKTFFLLFCCPN